MCERQASASFLAAPVSLTARPQVMPPADDDQSREVAARIGREFPRWLVLHGSYTRQFVAFSLFAVPGGGFVTAYSPDALIARMRAVQQQNPAEERTPGAYGT